MDTLELGKIYELSKKLGKVKFSELVKASSGFDVMPIDQNDTIDKELVQKLKIAFNNFVKVSKKATRYTGARVNDIGSALEETITQEILKTDMKIEKLGSSGYPDLVVYYKNKVAYIELKVSGNKKKVITHHRLFYYTSGKKIKKNAHHLLLQIELSEERDKLWIVDEWTLRDLSNLEVGLKAEFNTNQQGFDKIGELASGGSE